MSIYDELLKLQIIPEAFEKWKDYRKELTDYIISVTKPGSSLAVFGAGSCNDINLAELNRHFGHITLIDRDKRGLFEALDTYHLEKSRDITLKESDFLGIAPGEYREYADDVLRMIQVDGKNTDMDEVAEYAVLRMKELYQKAEERPLDFGQKSYDYAVAAGVHSQINNMFAWLWQVYLEAVGKKESTVLEFVKQKNEVVIPRFHNALFACAKEGVILACERKRIGMEGGIQGSLQALQDVVKRQEAGECLISESISLRWPFDLSQDIIYQMSVLNIVFDFKD